MLFADSLFEDLPPAAPGSSGDNNVSEKQTEKRKAEGSDVGHSTPAKKLAPGINKY